MDIFPGGAQEDAQDFQADEDVDLAPPGALHQNANIVEVIVQPHPYDLVDERMKRLQQPLAPGCNFTLLGTIEQILLLQGQTKSTHTAMERTMTLVNDIVGADNRSTFRQAKSMVEEVSLRS